MIRRIACGLAASSALAASTYAAAFTGNELLSWERDGASNPLSWDAGAHSGYIAGVSDAANGVLFCLPQGVTYRQSMAVVKKYAEKHPEKLHNVAANVIAWALKEQFPCKE